ncbi:malic enzyme, NAD binding domain protein [Pseudoramibacter alactolyticus ATCC 23263]|uniref:Malic enzyme, NAD binding domain protein n=1 Tax=Pseudoramibacter alactolyticus ATCC 23263 TaxID=887929 RepID=E6MFE7_9FIRM|nr:NADP-dependent malic enzyme [Pseudoramibacter alactolyticus]EFV02307.1 malic enzyme, NAD binding domain protein [Pseudoramibacter alactolyticus ATCC 23263]
MDYNKAALAAHQKHQGKVAIASKLPVTNQEELSIAYTPGVAEPCRKIAENRDAVYTYTAKGNLVAVLSDGSAVLGLGNIGGHAAMPVMEGKAVLFKEFGDIDAFPICVSTQDADAIVQTGINIAPTFGGINLEDIAAPKCFEVEERLQAALDIPVFHDDQHGTAIVVASSLINAMKVVGKELTDITVAINGAGSAGTAIAKMLMTLGVGDIVVSDIDGILTRDKEGLNPYMRWLAEHTNRAQRRGHLADAMAGADVLIGVSAPNIVSEAMVASMAEDAVIFAMANPVPEIMPDAAKRAGARVVGTGRSDFPNQINNVLAFPGIFRGALDVRAKRITEAMKTAAAYAIAGIITDDERDEDHIIPSPFDKRVTERVAEAVGKAWTEANEAK